MKDNELGFEGTSPSVDGGVRPEDANPSLQPNLPADPRGGQVANLGVSKRWYLLVLLACLYIAAPVISVIVLALAAWTPLLWIPATIGGLIVLFALGYGLWRVQSNARVAIYEHGFSCKRNGMDRFIGWSDVDAYWISLTTTNLSLLGTKTGSMKIDTAFGIRIGTLDGKMYSFSGYTRKGFALGLPVMTNCSSMIRDRWVKTLQAGQAMRLAKGVAITSQGIGAQEDETAWSRIERVLLKEGTLRFLRPEDMKSVRQMIRAKGSLRLPVGKIPSLPVLASILVEYCPKACDETLVALAGLAS